MAFTIRVQRTTALPDGDITVLRIPFTNRMWEIYEIDPDTGKTEYFGFALTHAQAVNVVSDVLRQRHRRASLEEFRRLVAKGEIEALIGKYRFRLGQYADGRPRLYISFPLSDPGEVAKPMEAPC